jgi:hypothetical protein
MFMGGGGGAGLVWLTIDNAMNIIPKLEGGTAGLSDDIKAIDGGNGEKLNGFSPTLNGLLFNSICSSVSGNQNDSITLGSVPPKIMGNQMAREEL